MHDLLSRLRARAAQEPAGSDALLTEAADEIERLRAERKPIVIPHRPAPGELQAHELSERLWWVAGHPAYNLDPSIKELLMAASDKIDLLSNILDEIR